MRQVTMALLLTGLAVAATSNDAALALAGVMLLAVAAYLLHRQPYILEN